jgi:cytochrome d ubiquinol oxidase subunit II
MLADVPLVFMLLGLAAYAVLGGADFGAGIWTLTTGRDEHGRRLREHAHHSMGPVWEANHVWLIFILVVCWTAYPTAFSSITSTLAIPLFVAAVGIILRGSAYALRVEGLSVRQGDLIDRVFALSSILTPFALGTVAGAIASGRVPVGNARGDLVTSWLNPTSVIAGTITVVAGAYLAAVYLAADASRAHETTLVVAFRQRALAAGIVAGALALGGLVVVHHDAPRIAHGLGHGGGLAAVVVSGLCGLATLALVTRTMLGAARATAALAVGAVIAGWALAQRPEFLPGLTISEAAAGRSTLIAVTIAVAVGCVVLVPSLGLLFALVLRGRFDAGAAAVPSRAPQAEDAREAQPVPVVLPLAFAAAGTALLVLFDSGWAHLGGMLAFAACVCAIFPALARPPDD